MFRIYCLLSLLPVAAFGQSEAALKRAFEGRRVTVKLEMPATKYGVDVTDSQDPIDFRVYSNRIKQYGIALRPGDDVLITGIKVKESHIEFQLAGGGYGTIGDDTNTNVYVADSRKSHREKRLEKAVKEENDPRVRRKMKEELEDLRSDRRREDQIARAEAAEASEIKRESIRQRALEAGSRFNLRYAKGALDQSIPTPEMVTKSLGQWIDFGRL